VLPNANHAPSGRREPGISIRVSKLVRSDLGFPELAIRSRHRSVLRTSVPEAAVDEHRNALGAEHDIRSSAKSGQDCTVKPISKPEPVQLVSQCKLRACVSQTDTLHPRESFR
jgi:hypothetical protein